MSKAFIPYLTRLTDVIDEINQSPHRFITFRVQSGSSNIISNVTINFCRFRDAEMREDMIEARSCDCEGLVCGHPTQKIYISKDYLKDYVFIEEKSGIHMLFVCNVLMFENTNVQRKPGIPD